MYLRQTSELGEIIRRAVVCQNGETFKAMADILLRLHIASNIGPQEFYSALNLLIDELAELPDCDTSKLARYTRCLFQAMMGLDTELAFGELQSACNMARRTVKKTGFHWPREELEWIATVAYNHGLDLSGQDDEEGAKRWVETAMNLAQYNDDGGAIQTNMYDNFMSLQLSHKS